MSGRNTRIDRTAHKARMIERREQQRTRTSDFRWPILANVSRNHPDHGMSPKEHAKAKAMLANGELAS